MMQEELLLVHLTVAVPVRLVDHLLQLCDLGQQPVEAGGLLQECRLFLSLEGQREAQGNPA